MDYVALDFSKPQLDLIEPRRVGWREVKTPANGFGILPG
jgi:hypothetical protein